MAVKKTYSEEEKTALVDLAQIVGIGRAVRELGYPTWPTAQAWCKARGVEPALDTVMQEVKKYHTFMETTDAILVAETAFGRVMEMLQDHSLDPDGLKKTTESLQKTANTWLLLQGKATAISQSQQADAVDVGLIDLVNTFRATESSRDLDTRSTSKK